MTGLRRFLGSMAGRVFIILLLGIVTSASLALALADAKRRADIDRINLERVVDRTKDFVALLNRTPPTERARLPADSAAGVRLAPAPPSGGERDVALTRLLAQRLQPGAAPMALRARLDACMTLPRFGGPGRRPAPEGFFRPPECWYVILRLSDGAAATLVVDAPPRLTGLVGGPDLVYLGLLALAAAALALVVARMTAEPLNAFADAAAALGQDLGRSPLPEAGPWEVGEAARAFNRMQTDLKRHMNERTQMLAAITHDLQTPITRMRLRLEKVAEDSLRERLIGDLTAMQALIREGLELARSEQTAEDLVVLDLPSLLESVVEDAQDAGQPVALDIRGVGDVLARPGALRRCLENLIENAVKYGLSAEVSCSRSAEGLQVSVRDHGPGVPDDQIEALFDPFVRLETSRSRATGGTGLGLAIARRLARQNGADLRLRNHPDGGLEATLSLSVHPDPERPAAG